METATVPEEPILLKIPPPSPAEPPCQLVILQTVYHQSPGQDAAGSESRVGRTLASDEQPYIRHTRAGDEWKPLDTDWIPDPGLVVIENRGTQFRVNPTEAEKAEAARKTVIVAADPQCDPSVGPTPFAEIPPGESLTLSPREIDRWRIKCAVGSVAITISAYPK